MDLGERFDGKVEILSGINPEELVVTNGNYLLQEGRAVSVSDGPAPTDTAT